MKITLPIRERIVAFSMLGDTIRSSVNQLDGFSFDLLSGPILEAVHNSSISNRWFTTPMIRSALLGIASMLEKPKLDEWLSRVELPVTFSDRKVMVVSAGNIPAVGFHDWLCVMMAGFRYVGKLSADDQHLIPAMAKLLEVIEPKFKGRSEFTTGLVSNFDAVIATGSSNTNRYFDYYFSKWPRIVRSNRSGLAILNGTETRDELARLSDDVFLFYGLGCRNVSACLVPKHFDAGLLADALAAGANELTNNHKWVNNYDYQKAIMLVNNEPFVDNGSLLLRYAHSLVSPVAVLNLIPYENVDEALDFVTNHATELQCTVSSKAWFNGSLDFGKAQLPGPGDYADGVDVMKFLTTLR